MAERDITRREVLHRGLYVPPAILTLVAVPSFASAGSGASPRQRGERLREIAERLREHRDDRSWGSR
jgi:hypothetical protein